MSRTHGMAVAGAGAAKRMSLHLGRSRMRGSRDQGASRAASWCPVTLHWRRIQRLRAPHPGSTLPCSRTSIFAQFVLHLVSNLTAVEKSAAFTIVNSSVPLRSITRDVILHRREAIVERASREQIVSRFRERYETLARADRLLLAGLQARVDASSQTASFPPLCSAGNFSVIARSTALTRRISNNSVNHEHHAAPRSITILGLPADRHEPASRVSLHSVSPSRVVHRSELVWRQPQAATKSETHEVRPPLPNLTRRPRVATFDPAARNEPAAKSVPPPAVSPFDAAQMDRLVDNVIQRFDKRVRIERERRGW
jgi:hypothetical protein